MTNDQPKGKKTTLDDLAAMMQREFDQTRKEMQAGFYRIEKILLAKQEKRITKLEQEVKELRDALAM